MNSTTEFNGIILQDDSAPDDSRLCGFIDRYLSKGEQQGLVSITQHGGGITMVWRDHVPARWVRMEDGGVDVRYGDGDDDADFWMVFNEVSAQH